MTGRRHTALACAVLFCFLGLLSVWGDQVSNFAKVEAEGVSFVDLTFEKRAVVGNIGVVVSPTLDRGLDRYLPKVSVVGVPGLAFGENVVKDRGDEGSKEEASGSDQSSEDGGVHWSTIWGIAGVSFMVGLGWPIVTGVFLAELLV